MDPPKPEETASPKETASSQVSTASCQAVSSSSQVVATVPPAMPNIEFTRIAASGKAMMVNVATLQKLGIRIENNTNVVDLDDSE